MKNINRRTFLQAGGALAAAGAAPALGLWPTAALAAEPVKLGLLHSLTGTVAIAEVALVDAEKLAIEEINAQGGVLGRRIEAVLEDGASDWPMFAEKAKKLLQRDHVAAVIGCYTSASRKAVLPVFNQLKGLLYYPTYYEGQEQDKAVIYTSQEATQSVIAAVEWMAQQQGKTLFLVGSDYIYPRTCNKIARATVTRGGGQVVGEEYAPLGHTDFSSIINKIKAARPDWVYSTVVGGSNVAFYKQLKAAGLDGGKQKLLSTVVQENEVEGIGHDSAAGYYSCAGYFQSVQNAANQRFVKAFKARYGQQRVIGDPMQCAYNSVYLWKLAAEKARSFEVDKVIAASAGLEFDAPEGRIRIHASNHHTSKRVRIARARSDGQFDILYESGVTEPNPFPQL